MAGTLTVNPTRMELTRLKRRLKTATRGHKLLKDKRDEMMRRFVLLIRENQRIRLQVEEKLGMALGEFAICRGAMDSAMLEQALMCTSAHRRRRSGHDQYNVGQGAYVCHRQSSGRNAKAQLRRMRTSATVDGAIEQLADVLPDLIALAQIRKKTCIYAGR